MTYQTIVSTEELAQHLEDPVWVVIDCRFSLAETEKGRADYLVDHIPGAVYAHLDEDLCSPVIPGQTGRHPLPAVEQLADKFSNWGIGPGVQVVVYDDWSGASGAIAARLWWSLRWLGHAAAAVLDGGWERWLAEGRPTRSGEETRLPRTFNPQIRPELLATSEDVDWMRRDANYLVVDSRAVERYRGEVEPIDPVAGHIPGAVVAPYPENMNAEGLFLPHDDLRARFEELAGGFEADKVVFYCGSGVTGAHNVLAFAHAGLGAARLYAGSWSEWITDAERPVAKRQ
ncbi:MAG: sulfurtransferase [Anaerolineales bacterium]|jgi:thiosulfate/3-mercaptopyruvate sulfurtransferase